MPSQYIENNNRPILA